MHKLQQKPKQQCYHCEGSHSPQTCRFLNEECRYCRKKGHVAWACRARKRKGGTNRGWRNQQEKTQAVKKIEGDMKQDDNGSDEEGALYTIGTNQWTTDNPAIVTVEIEGTPIRMELLGRNWLGKIPIDWHDVKQLTMSDPTDKHRIDSLLKKYPSILQKTIGKMANIRGRLNLKEGVAPVFLKARPVPYSLRKSVELELEKLVKEGVLTPVSWSEWATPIVVVPKADGSVRIVGISSPRSTHT